VPEHLFQAQATGSLRSCDADGAGVAPGRERGLELRCWWRDIGITRRAPGNGAALLGPLLVLQDDGLGPRGLVDLDGAADAQRVPVARVDGRP